MCFCFFKIKFIIAMAAESFLWIVIAGNIAAFMTAFAIGANDVANTFSTAVGGGALNLKTAIILGSIFEILGATLLGNAVTNTIRKKIIDFNVFNDSPEILMIGLLCCLLGSGLWVLIATYLALPVSTTHSIIGSLIGFGIGSGNFGAIHWNMIGVIVLCWLCAPLVSGLFGSLCFAVIRTFILRHSNAVNRGYKALYVLMLLICSTFTYFLVFHNPFRFSNECFQVFENGEFGTASPCVLAGWARANISFAFLTVLFLSFVLASAFSVCAYYLAAYKLRLLKSGLDELEKPELNLEALDTDFSQYSSCNMKMVDTLGNDTLESTSAESACNALSLPDSILYIDGKMTNHNSNSFSASTSDFILPKKSIWTKLGSLDMRKEEELDEEIRFSAEEFPTEIEVFFSACQVFSSCLGCVAHSTNDTANVIGPWSLIYFAYRGYSLTTLPHIPWYIFFFGGFSMALGLSLLGHKVVTTIGNKLVKITPSRGFSIDVGAAWVVMLFSAFGIPLSTTHSTVGSVVGVGFIEKGATNMQKSLSGKGDLHLNKKLLINIFVSWIMTLFFSALVTMSLFSFAVYSPTLV